MAYIVLLRHMIPFSNAMGSFGNSNRFHLTGQSNWDNEENRAGQLDILIGSNMKCLSQKEYDTLHLSDMSTLIT